MQLNPHFCLIICECLWRKEGGWWLPWRSPPHWGRQKLILSTSLHQDCHRSAQIYKITTAACSSDSVESFLSLPECSPSLCWTWSPLHQVWRFPPLCAYALSTPPSGCGMGGQRWLQTPSQGCTDRVTAVNPWTAPSPCPTGLSPCSLAEMLTCDV